MVEDLGLSGGTVAYKLELSSKPLAKGCVLRLREREMQTERERETG